MLSLPEGIAIEDEFVEGKECCLLYAGMHQAGRNLCERLGEDEDSDVEISIAKSETNFSTYFDRTEDIMPKPRTSSGEKNLVSSAPGRAEPL